MSASKREFWNESRNVKPNQEYMNRWFGTVRVRRGGLRDSWRPGAHRWLGTEWSIHESWNIVLWSGPFGDKALAEQWAQYHAKDIEVEENHEIHDEG
jgi:hypothetical protein